MKKIIAVLCVLVLACAAVTASADLYKANTPETLKALLGGKTYAVRITGLSSVGQDEDTKFTISVTICERERFDAAVVENLAAGDFLRFRDGSVAVITEVAADEFGVTAKGVDFDAYNFTKQEDGTYIACMENDFPLYADVCTVSVPLEKDITFLDWSDPENLDEPVKLGFDELLDHLYNNTNFSPYNMQITFDENGKPVEFLYNYSPWN